MSRDFLYWTHDVHDVLLHFKWSLPLSMEVVCLPGLSCGVLALKKISSLKHHVSDTIIIHVALFFPIVSFLQTHITIIM